MTYSVYYSGGAGTVLARDTDKNPKRTRRKTGHYNNQTGAPKGRTGAGLKPASRKACGGRDVWG